MNVQELPFVNPVEINGYCIFPDEYENDSNIVFHGTSMQFFESIMENGFCSAKALNCGDLRSVSFPKSSANALDHVLRRWKNDERIIFAASLEDIKTETVVDNTGIIYIFDPNPKPKIIAYCVVPKDYHLK